MVRKVLYSLLLVGLLASCASTFGVANLGSKVKKLELGMSKKEALNILGKTYDVVAVSQTPEGNVEILSFFGTNGPTYIVHFLDGKLVEYHLDRPMPGNNIIINESRE